MALHLITGYAGREHITSADQGAYNIATFGGGNIVFDRGQKFKATIKTNNVVNIADGEAMIQGRFLKMPTGTTEDVSISNGTQGRYRNDLICIRYEKSATDSTESTKLVVIKGTESTGTPADPSYNNGSITDGTATITDFPLYRVSLNGINISSVTPLFSVVVSMADYMKNYQMPTASKTQAGAVKIGSGINVSGGTISVPVPTPYSLPTANTNVKGGVMVGNGLSMDGEKLKISDTLFKHVYVTKYLDIPISAQGKEYIMQKIDLENNKQIPISISIADTIAYGAGNFLPANASISKISDNTTECWVNCYVANMSTNSGNLNGLQFDICVFERS